MGLGSRIRIYRERKGYGLTAFARLIGVSHPALHEIETENHGPSSKSLLKLFQNTNINPAWLFHGKGPMEINTEETTSHLIPLLKDFPDSFPAYIPPESMAPHILLSETNVHSIYGLLVKGDAMAPTIQDGDYVFFTMCEWTDLVKGDVLVLKNQWGQPVVRRYFQAKKKIHLVADNPAYGQLAPDDLILVGKLLQVWRKINV